MKQQNQQQIKKFMNQEELYELVKAEIANFFLENDIEIATFMGAY